MSPGLGLDQYRRYDPKVSHYLFDYFKNKPNIDI